MKVEKFLTNYFQRLIEKFRSLVVYDSSVRYRDIVFSLSSYDCEIIDGSKSTIISRECAMSVWRKLVDDQKGRKYLIIYIPIDKPKTDGARQLDPYQIFALGGAEFPSGDGESYQTLCRKAFPEFVDEIDELFGEKREPEFSVINNLVEGGVSWPVLRSILKVDSATEILIVFLAPSEAKKHELKSNTTWVTEFQKFSQDILGLKIKTKSKNWKNIRDELWRYILFSEFIFDFPNDLPKELQNVPHSSKKTQDLIYSVCEQLRTSEKYQSIYIEMANKVENDLRLNKYIGDLPNLGQRDTFAFEERAFLKTFSNYLVDGDFESAHKILEDRKDSIWVKHEAKRQTLWTLAERSLFLLDSIKETKHDFGERKKDLNSILTFYCDRMRVVDRLHREFEQAVADTFGEVEDLEKSVEKTRIQYRNFAENAQKKFIEQVEKEGWPSSGFIYCTEVFEKFVAPSLEDKIKVAYFMIDSLRYELACELEGNLSSEYKCELHTVCAQLPTITSVGMAALLPETKGNLILAEKNGEMIPRIKDKEISTPTDRLKYISQIYGDRCSMLDINELLRKKKINVSATVDLLIIKTTDIDSIFEANPIEAKQIMPKLINKVIAGINRVSSLGFEKAVLVTDHGFIIFDELGAGNVVEEPQGDWQIIKNRSLLGKGSGNIGTIAFNKEEVSISGDFDQFVVPRTFATFAKTSPYFHGGLSLQECVLPVICVDLIKAKEEKVEKFELRLSYKGGNTKYITTMLPMIEITLFKTDLFVEEELEFLLEAYYKNKVVGEVGTSSHINPATNFISIRANQAFKVPLKMEESFRGEFEVKAIDPATSICYASLKLKTDYTE